MPLFKGHIRSQYIKLLDSSSLTECLDRERGEDTHLPLVKSLRLTLDFFRNRNAVALISYGVCKALCPEEKLLFIISNFEHTDIPESLVHDIFCSAGGETEASYLKARDSLCLHQIISIRPEVELLSIHPLFHKIFRAHFIEPLQEKPRFYQSSYWTLNYWFGYKTLIDYQLNLTALKAQHEVDFLSRTTLMELSPHLTTLREVLKSISSAYYQEKNKVALLEVLAEKDRLLGNFDKAKELYSEVLELKQKLYGFEDIEIARTHEGLGNAYCDLGGEANIRIAVDHYKEAVKIIKRKQLSERAPQLARTLTSLGKATHYLGRQESDLKIEIAYYEEALRILAGFSTDARVDRAKIFYNLAVAYFALGGESNIRKAIENYEAAFLAMKYAIPGGEGTPHILWLLAGLGDAYASLGGEVNIRKTIKSYEEFLTIIEMNTGESDPIILSRLARAYITLADKPSIERAKDLLERSITLSNFRESRRRVASHDEALSPLGPFFSKSVKPENQEIVLRCLEQGEFP